MSEEKNNKVEENVKEEKNNQVEEKLKEEKGNKVEQKVKKEKTDKVGQKAKKEKNDKSNKKIGKVILGVVTLAVVLVVAYIVLISASTPKKSVESMLSTLKTGEFTKLENVVDNKDAFKTEELAGDDSLSEEGQKLLFDKLEWKVGKVTTEGEKASVEIEITNKDFKTIIGNYIQKVIKVAFSGKEVDDKEFENYLIEELKNEAIQSTTQNKIIQTVKQDGKWVVVTDEELMKTLLPGLQEAVEAFNQ